MIDIIIDSLTNSIRNTISGDQFNTEIIQVIVNEKGIAKKDWVFDWRKEIQNVNKEVYKLVIVNNEKINQGLISISDNNDHIFMNLIESAKFNKGKSKLYEGVPGNLVAFACRLAFEKGYDGVVSFIAKTKLVNHYKTSLGATIFHGDQMFIDTPAALKLIRQYFNK
jgi:hypothetical protein